MVRCFPCVSDFGQSNNAFYRISKFLEHNFCLAARWKIDWNRWIWFFLYFPAEIFEFSFIPVQNWMATGVLGQGVNMIILVYFHRKKGNLSSYRGVGSALRESFRWFGVTRLFSTRRIIWNFQVIQIFYMFLLVKSLEWRRGICSCSIRSLANSNFCWLNQTAW